MHDTAVRTSSALILLLLAAASANAQATSSVTIAGHAIDPQGQPMAGLEVLLHRVDGSSGSSLGSAVTDSVGAFSITAEAAADTQAIYFAAARVDGELYIGPFVRQPTGTGAPYMLVVGGEPVSLGPAMPGAVPSAVPGALPPVSPGGGTRRQLLVLLPLIGLLGVAGWALTRGTRPPARRRTLTRLAAIDEDLGQDGSDPELESERARLVERLLAD